MQLTNYSDDLEIGTRYLHKKTGVVWILTKVGRIHGNTFAAVIQDPAGRSVQVPPGVLIAETIYSIAEPEPSAGILAIGSVAIDYDGPEPEPAAIDPEPELVFKRGPGRQAKPKVEYQSYFGEAKKLGPHKKKI